MNHSILEALDDLVLAGNLLFELYRWDAVQKNMPAPEIIPYALKSAQNWLTSPQSLCFNKIPQHLLLANEGKEIINFLKAKQGL